VTKTVRSDETHGGTGRGQRLGSRGTWRQSIGGAGNLGHSRAERSEASTTGAARQRSAQRHRQPGALDGGAIEGVDGRGRSAAERSGAELAGPAGGRVAAVETLHKSMGKDKF
jgi:hypothetical protein